MILTFPLLKLINSLQMGRQWQCGWINDHNGRTCLSQIYAK